MPSACTLAGVPACKYTVRAGTRQTIVSQVYVVPFLFFALSLALALALDLGLPFRQERGVVLRVRHTNRQCRQCGKEARRCL